MHCCHGAVQANQVSAAEKAGIESSPAIQGINSAGGDGSGGHTQPDQPFQELSVFCHGLWSFTDQPLQNLKVKPQARPSYLRSDTGSIPHLWSTSQDTGLPAAHAQGTAEQQKEPDPLPPGSTKSTPAYLDHY